MGRGNVLVIGNSGVGKSTLINAVLGDDCEKKAKTGYEIKGITDKLEIYESSKIPFRVLELMSISRGIRIWKKKIYC